ncbi:MAG: glycosyltransferase [Eubacteriales bacterium]|nr:glycosyltransferase [Eubacteriales bacterium]
MKKINKLTDYIQKYGIRLFVYKVMHKLTKKKSSPEESQFEIPEYVNDFVLENTDMKFSILVPAYHTPEKFLREMLSSVVEQTYPNWELCIADGSSDDSVWNVVKQYDDSRIIYKKLKENKGISENTNAALEFATGDFIGLLDHDDILEKDALECVAKEIGRHPKADVLYSDEDKVSWNTERYFEPHYKTDFDLMMLRENNYICHFFVVKKSILDLVGGFRKEYDGAQDYDLILRCVEQAEEVRHISKVLYHWRVHEQSTAMDPESKMYAYEAGKNAILAHLERMHESGEVRLSEYPGFYELDYQVEGNPNVVIAVTGNVQKKNFLKIKKTMGYENVRFIRGYDHAEVMKKVRETDDYIVLIDGAVQVRGNGWLRQILGCVQRKDVDVVVGRLFDKKESVLYAGVKDGKRAYQGISKVECGYFHREVLQQTLDSYENDMLIMSAKEFLHGASREKMIVLFPRWEGKRLSV